MKKNSSVHIKLSYDEKELIRRRAEGLGLNISSYIRFLLLNAVPRIEMSSK